MARGSKRSSVDFFRDLRDSDNDSETKELPLRGKRGVESAKVEARPSDRCLSAPFGELVMRPVCVASGKVSRASSCSCSSVMLLIAYIGLVLWGIWLSPTVHSLLSR